MSYTHHDTDSDQTGVENSDNSFRVDQVEIGWLFDFAPVTARVETQFRGNRDPLRGGEEEFRVEQAFVSHHLGEGGAITIGSFFSMLGFEEDKPAGLFQFSEAYETGEGSLNLIPFLHQGIKYTHETDTKFFGVSVQDGSFNGPGRLGGSGESSWSVEAAGSITPVEGLTLFIGGNYEELDDGPADANGDTWLVNTFGSYEKGAWLFAGELNYGEGAFFNEVATPFQMDSADIEAWSALLMANYAYSEQGSLTGRVSWINPEGEGAAGFGGGVVDPEIYKLTLAHNWAFTDNLALVTEFSYLDSDDAGDFEETSLAARLLFSF